MTPAPPVLKQRSCLEAVLSYAATRWPVLPLHGSAAGSCSCRQDCGRAGKHPRILEWQNAASTDPEQIRAWWKDWPDANIGILCGTRSGLLLLDVDPDKGGLESLARLEEKHGALPKTRRDRTGRGGWHYFFRHPGGQIPNSTSRIGPGLDIKSDGGYVVAPPSRTTGVYEWEDPAATIVDPPEWLVTAAKGPKVYYLNGSQGDTRPAPARGMKEALEKVTQAAIDLLADHYPAEGHRHDFCLALAGALLRARWTVEETEEFIGRVADQAGDPEVRNRVDGVQDTLAKLQEGKAATGVPTFGVYLPPDVLAKLKAWLGLAPLPSKFDGSGSALARLPVEPANPFHPVWKKLPASAYAIYVRMTTLAGAARAKGAPTFEGEPVFFASYKTLGVGLSNNTVSGLTKKLERSGLVKRMGLGWRKENRSYLIANGHLQYQRRPPCYWTVLSLPSKFDGSTTNTED